MSILDLNKIEILEVSRPNPNPKNIEGRAVLNGWDVVFNVQELSNGHLKPNWVIFPQNVGWDRIIKGSSSTGHKYYALLAIMQKLQKENWVKK